MTTTSTHYACPICGSDIIHTAGKGRPKSFCSVSCRKVSTAMDQLRMSLADVTFVSADLKNSFRGDLQSLSNSALNG